MVRKVDFSYHLKGDLQRKTLFALHLAMGGQTE
jgi:hypothetical protein